MGYLQFLGAAGTVTGSKFLLNSVNDETGRTGSQVLVDCGLFQGPKEWREKNWQDLPMNAQEIEAVILTHAHLDHCGWIPRLVREGFKGPIYATPPTVDLCGIVLPDSAYLQEEDAAFHNKVKSSKHEPALPLYTVEDAEAALQQLKPVSFGQTVQVTSDVSFCFVRSAHILGAAMANTSIRVDGHKRNFLFTGDIGRVQNHIAAPGKVVHSGPAEGETPDVLVMESTYGNRRHPSDDVRPQLARLIRDTVKRGGSIVVPAFAVERTQKFLLLVEELMDAGEIPRIPVFSDSPMSIKVDEVFLKYQEEFDQEAKDLIARHGSPMHWPNFHFATTAEESKKINECKYPCIIVSSNGMCMGGRIQHHLALRLPDPRNLILFIGFQAVGTRGRQIKEGAREVKIYGNIIPVHAQVASLEQFSDHADLPELLDWLSTFKKSPAITHIVHGEPASAQSLKAAIQDKMRWNVNVASYKQKIALE
ncbi:MAG TPA: MBL fold metallo-hydrolase [Candidatus Acidoferrales bacterium]|nr:MBL fold metallo-hydrolase [Candidatus Acidoferrales bacterium]